MQLLIPNVTFFGATECPWPHGYFFSMHLSAVVNDEIIMFSYLAEMVMFNLSKLAMNQNFCKWCFYNARHRSGQIV